MGGIVYIISLKMVYIIQYRVVVSLACSLVSCSQTQPKYMCNKTYLYDVCAATVWYLKKEPINVSFTDLAAIGGIDNGS